MLQDQNIKGFTLLELLVVIAIVAIVSAVGMPNFMKWQKDRELRNTTEKISNAINMANTRTENGSLSVVQILFESFGNTTKVTVRGIDRKNFSDRVNKGRSTKCESNANWFDKIIDEQTYSVVTNIQSRKKASICFSLREKYYGTSGDFNGQSNYNLENSSNYTDKFIILCTDKNGSLCPKPKKKDDIQKPAYLIEWTRFGNVNKFRWSDNGSWTRM